MKVVIIDDMIAAQNMLERVLLQFEEIESIVKFSRASVAIEYIKENSVDFIFLDMEMPGMNGIEFIKQIEQFEESPFVAFVTGHSDYSIDAWKTKAIGYILKPFNESDIKQVIEKYKFFKEANKMAKVTVEIKCFPGFDVFKNGRPIAFHSKKAKEILAYLVQNQGQWVNINTLSFIILGEIDEKKAQNRVRSYLSRLRRELLAAGFEDLLEREYGKCRVNTNLFTCDYYSFLKGDYFLFNGEYMLEYSWAESVKIEMEKKQKLINN
ncbi:MAG: response regulator [Clostridium sp.]|nr:response regulator [Clostridium sp.]MDU7084353.1 response regulator [Clostridium sp.]